MSSDEPARKKSRSGSVRSRDSSQEASERAPDDSPSHHSQSPAPSPAPPPPSQTARNLADQYRELTNEMCSLDIRPDNTIDNAQRATNLMDRADVLADYAYNASGSAAATYDGEFMNATGQVVHRIAETMQVDARTFCLKEFALCLKLMLTGSRNHPVTKSKLAEFGRNWCRQLCSAGAPVAGFVRGSYEFAPAPVEEQAAPERPERKKRQRLQVSPTKTQPALIRSEESMKEVDKDQTVLEVEQLNSRVEDMYVENGEQPVPYLTIVVDRRNFGKTVENIFHFSFLVKEGYQRIVQHKGITCVQPVEEDERKATVAAPRRQLLFSFSEADWRQWRDKVRTPAYRVPRG